MKKILTAAAVFLLISTATFAQAVKKTVAKAPENKMKVVAAKPAAAPIAKVVPITKTVAKTKNVVTAKPATSSPVVLKKDGTPDKRYSNASKSAGPTKKDGTPDMRYKKNKKS